MKAQRRHELQENTLANVLQNLPIAARLYADKILLVIVIIMAIVLLIRWRINAAQDRALGAANALAEARASIRGLTLLNALAPRQPLADERNRLRAEADSSLQVVSRDAPANDAKLRSEALLAKGDLLWTLANLPEIPGAATQPSLKFAESRDELLKEADQTYQQLIQTYGNQPRARIAGLFALAAIAEDRQDFDAATKLYDQIKQSAAEDMYKELADERLKLLSDLRQPMLLGAPTTRPAPLALPATRPATTRSAGTQPAR